MWYEINVARNGKHLFATAERSLTTKKDAIALYNEFIELFPDCDVTLTYYETLGKRIRS